MNITFQVLKMNFKLLIVCVTSLISMCVDCQPFNLKKFMLHNQQRNVVLTALPNGTIVSQQESDDLNYGRTNDNAWFMPCNVCAEFKEGSSFEVCLLTPTGARLKKLYWERPHGKVIASESEDAENQVVLKATIYQMRHSSPEGASLFINHHGADSDVHRRALLVLPPRTLPGSVSYVVPENIDDANGVQLHLKNVGDVRH